MTPAFIPVAHPTVDACVICGHGKPTRELRVAFKNPQTNAERGVLVLRCCAKCYRKRTRQA